MALVRSQDYVKCLWPRVRVLIADLKMRVYLFIAPNSYVFTSSGKLGDGHEGFFLLKRTGDASLLVDSAKRGKKWINSLRYDYTRIFCYETKSVAGAEDNFSHHLLLSPCIGLYVSVNFNLR